MWIARILTLALAVLFPVSWLAPLAHARVLPYFSGSEISIVSGVVELSKTDVFLCAIVALFAILIPYAKTLALVGAQFGFFADNRRAAGIVSALGKLSMADVFLVALYIVLVKGVGIGSVVVDWGLYLFTVLVLVSIIASWLTLRALDRSKEQGS